MARTKRKSKIIAPRLASGLKRESIGHGLPPEIKEGLKYIAASKNESVSWMLEGAIIDFIAEHYGFKKLSIERPKYIPRKRKTEND